MWEGMPVTALSSSKVILACLDTGLRISTWHGVLPSEAGDLPEAHHPLVTGPCPRSKGNWRWKAMF